MKYRGIIAVLVILLGVSPAWAASDSSAAPDSAAASGSPTAPDPGSKPPKSTFLQKFDATHEAISREIDDFSERIDMFLGGDKSCEISQDSYLQVGASAVALKGGGVVFDRILRARVDLPNTQRRFRLLLETDPDRNFRENLAPGARSTTESSNLTAQGPGQNLSAALQYVMEERLKWAASIDGGIQVEFPPDPFARGKLRRSFTLGDDWRFTFGETVFYFVSLGPGSSTQFELEKYLPTAFSFCQSLFRSTTVATWREREDGKGFDLNQGLTLHQELTWRSVLTYKFGIAGQAKETTQVNDWGFGVEFRHKIYKEWLYLSAEPAIVFSKANNFEANPSFRVTVDIAFGGRFYK